MFKFFRVQEFLGFILPQKKGIEVLKLTQGRDSSLEDQRMDFWRSPLEGDLKT